MALQIGDVAPGFELFDTDKNKVSLESLRGKPVVLLFFPLAFTGTCTTEFCTIRDDFSAYQVLPAELLAISVDSLFTLKRYKEDQSYPFSFLSDFNKETSRAYGALYESFGFDMRGVSKRAVFVIDAQGLIRYAEVLENAGQLPNFDMIKQTLSGLA